MTKTQLDRRAATLGFGATLAAPYVARAQSGAPIKIVAPFPAGGSVDAIARLVQGGLQQRLGAPVIIENRPGASGALGAGMVAKAAPDGLTWLFVFDTHAVNPALQPSMTFDTQKDLDPVMLIGTAPMVLCTHPTRPHKTLADVIAAAKAKPDTVTYGTIGAGSLGHLAMVLLGKRAGVEWRHVPYRGGGPLANDMLAGHIDLGIASSALFAPHVAASSIRPLVQTASQRLPALKDVPTVAESGFPGYEADAWWGVFAPAKTPTETIERFRAALEASLKDERAMKTLVEAQQVNLMAAGPERLRAFLDEQMKKWAQVVRDNNIKADT